MKEKEFAIGYYFIRRDNENPSKCGFTCSFDQPDGGTGYRCSLGLDEGLSRISSKKCPGTGQYEMVLKKIKDVPNSGEEL